MPEKEPPAYAAPDPDEDPDWQRLVAWAESDLRRQLDRTLPPSCGIGATSVVHSALRRAVAKRHALPRPFMELKAYVFRIAQRVRGEKLRAGRAKKRQPAGGRVMPMGERDPARVEDPETAFVWEAVEQLPPNQRRLIRALYLERLDYGEYGARHGLTPRQVGLEHKRALEALHRRLAPPGGDP